MKTILTVLNMLGGTVLFIIIMSVGIYLLEENIVVLRWDWLEIPYFFGLGILTYHPLNYIYNSIETNKKNEE
jgi:hypothetical protein